MKPYLLCAALALSALPAWSAPAAPQSALARMPVKEITVFKDGHAFVVHEGKLPVDTNGNVQMDYLPTPVIGTFWPYAANRNIKLSAVTVGKRRVQVLRTALSMQELLEANPGLKANISDQNNPNYEATIVGVPARSPDELSATNPPDDEERLPEKGSVILLKVADGTAVVQLDKIKGITLKGDYKAKLASEEFRNLLTLKLNWGDRAPEKTADVGLMYVQKGLRWIPSYKVDIDGKGNARIKLQATLVNELTDLNDVNVNLVIGVPNFAFKDTVDPMSMQQAAAQLGQYFQADARTNYAFSNAIMTQSRRLEVNAPAPPPGDSGPEVAGQGRNEDLYVFNVKHISLRKGERMVVPVSEYTVKYRDVYTVDLPFTPPADMRANVNTDAQAEIARLMAAPKAQHKLRIDNTADQPFTTAPALIVAGDRVLGQSMMTYTSVKGRVDLAVTTAMDVAIKRIDKETGRTPNAMNWQGDQYARVDLAGSINVINYKDKPVDVEVTRYILGNADKADHGGTAEMVNVYEDSAFSGVEWRPGWWGYYSWPGWWGHFNGIGRFTWKVTLEAGKSTDLGYTWNYFWR